MKNGTHLTVTKSLHVALPYLVSQCQCGYLWIDQICINQNDPVERSAQVSIMRKIYSFGNSVLIWLGPETENTWILAAIVNLVARDRGEYKFFTEQEAEMPDSQREHMARRLWTWMCSNPQGRLSKIGQTPWIAPDRLVWSVDEGSAKHSSEREDILRTAVTVNSTFNELFAHCWVCSRFGCQRTNLFQLLRTN